MNRLIGWQSREFDEIELVYEKAEAKEQTGKLLGELEKTGTFRSKNELRTVNNRCGETHYLRSV